MGDTLKKFTEIMDLPPQVVMDVAKVTVTGNFEVIVENHKGLLEYSPQCVRVRAKSGEVTVTGNNLHLKLLYKDEIKIAGKIENIQLAQ